MREPSPFRGLVTRIRIGNIILLVLKLPLIGLWVWVWVLPVKSPCLWPAIVAFDGTVGGMGAERGIGLQARPSPGKTGTGPRHAGPVFPWRQAPDSRLGSPSSQLSRFSTVWV